MNFLFKMLFIIKVHLVSQPCVPGCSRCNYCIKQIFIQSVDDFVSFDNLRIPKLMYTDVNTKKTQALLWNNSIALIPKTSTVFSVLDDGYFYIVSTDLTFKTRLYCIL